MKVKLIPPPARRVARPAPPRTAASPSTRRMLLPLAPRVGSAPYPRHRVLGRVLRRRGRMMEVARVGRLCSPSPGVGGGPKLSHGRGFGRAA
jgi:hypothetical protein